MTEPMPDTLETLVPLWAEQHPDECVIDDASGVRLTGHIVTAKDAYGDSDSNLRFYGEGPDFWAVIIAGVLYHAARRGRSVKLESKQYRGTPGVGTVRVHDFDINGEREAFAGDMRVALMDGSATLRATATALLSAYLEATPDA